MIQTLQSEKSTIEELDRSRIENSGLFDPAFYRKQAGTLIGDENPLLHFLEHGNHLGLSPHPYFDTKFYLSKYPDIKKSNQNALVHFVNHGAREYRWPNKNFDPLYYLKIVPQAYAENYLIHYLRIGEHWQLPTCASKLPGHWRIPEIVALAFRSLLFFLLCSIYSFEHRNQFTSFNFFRINMIRFFQGCGSKVKFTVPSYLSQPKRLAGPESYQARILKNPIACVQLYLANVFKVQGFFAHAQMLLERLANVSSITDLALCSLGDLLLIQAIWANEFRNYEKDSIVLNLFDRWQKFNKNPTWHDCTFDRALDVIRKALDANANNSDAQWSLGYGLLAAGKYADALELYDKYPAKGSESIERKFFEARAKYGLDHNMGVARLRESFKSGSANWNIADLEIATAAYVPSSLLQEQVSVLESTKLLIESKTICNLELITRKNILEFGESYLSRFKVADVLPEYGIVTANNKLFLKESCHVKQCHASLFNSCIQEITDNGVLIFVNNARVFEEENCIYIGHNNNFYHWLIDDLPRLRLVDAGALYSDSPILIDEKMANWQYELMSMLGIDKNRLRKVDFRQPLSFKNLIIPSRLSRDMIAHPAAVSYMRKQLLPSVELQVAKGKRIYVNRTADSTIGRTMLNQNNIINKFKRNNFQIVNPSQLSVKEQIELFGDAEIIAGPVGAGLTNILFAPKQARILSLGPDQFICETYTSIACAIGQGSWSVRGASFPRPYPNLVWTNFDYEIDEKDIDLSFEHILT